MSQFIAIIKTFPYHSPRGVSVDIQMTSLEMIYPDGRDCGVPLYVTGYDEAAELLRLAGASAEELDAKRPSFEGGQEVRIALSADSGLVKAMGFNPRPISS